MTQRGAAVAVAVLHDADKIPGFGSDTPTGTLIIRAMPPTLLVSRRKRCNGLGKWREINATGSHIAESQLQPPPATVNKLWRSTIVQRNVPKKMKEQELFNKSRN
jgi:hypothetical protein